MQLIVNTTAEIHMKAIKNYAHFARSSTISGSKMRPRVGILTPAMKIMRLNTMSQAGKRALKGTTFGLIVDFAWVCCV